MDDMAALTLSDAAAASTAARGCCFANQKTKQQTLSPSFIPHHQKHKQTHTLRSSASRRAATTSRATGAPPPSTSPCTTTSRSSRPSSRSCRPRTRRRLALFERRTVLRRAYAIAHYTRVVCGVHKQASTPNATASCAQHLQLQHEQCALVTLCEPDVDGRVLRVSVRARSQQRCPPRSAAAVRTRSGNTLSDASAAPACHAPGSVAPRRQRHQAQETGSSRVSVTPIHQSAPPSSRRAGSACRL